MWWNHIFDYYYYTDNNEKPNAKTIRACRKAANRGDASSQCKLGDMLCSMHEDNREAAKWYRKAADQGNADAQYKLGSLYSSGVGFTKDHTESKKWFMRAAENGSAKAQLEMAAECNAEKKDDEEAKWFRMYAEQENAEKKGYLGYRFENGLGVPQDYGEAAKWYQKSAEQGDVGALCYLRLLLNKLTQQIKVEIVSWWGKFAEQGNANVQFELGNVYFKDFGIERDVNEAMKWYGKAADNGNADAMWALGNIYDRGEGVLQDFSEAANWYILALKHGNIYAEADIRDILQYRPPLSSQIYDELIALYLIIVEKGNPETQYALGLAYAKGKNDYPEALKWWCKAAEQGDFYAQLILWETYANGNSEVAKDTNKALEWLTKLAERGEASAQFTLGMINFNGEGISMNKFEAYKWWMKAARKGNEKAQKSLDILCKESPWACK